MKKYRAFLSYCHADNALATRLHRALEHFVAPKKSLAGGRRHPCAPIFRDREELSSGQLTPGILMAIDDSDLLIVLCTRASAKSEWVDREITSFLSQSGAEKIVAVLAGEQSPDVADLMPPTMSALHAKKGVRIIDLRARAEGFDGGVNHLVSHLTEIPLERVARAQSGRRRRRAGLIAAALAVSGAGLALALTSLVYFAGNWFSSIRYTYAALNIVDANGVAIVRISRLPGPGERAARTVLGAATTRIDGLAEMPAIKATPGAAEFINLLRMRVALRLAQLFWQAGQYPQALPYAQRARALALREKLSRLMFDDVVQEEEYGGHRGHSQPWIKYAALRESDITLANIEWALGDLGAAERVMDEALRAADQVLSTRDRTDEDRQFVIQARLALAVMQAESSHNIAEQHSALAPLYAAVAALPKSGNTDCCSSAPEAWSLLRDMYQVQAVVADLSASALRDDASSVRTLYPKAIAAIDHYEHEAGGPPAGLAYEAELNAAYVDEASGSAELTIIKSKAEQLIPALRLIVSSSGGNPVLQQVLSAQLQTLAMARARLGDADALPPLQEALRINEGNTHGDTDNAAFHSSYASTLGTAALVMAATHSCSAARNYQQQAIAQWNATASLERDNPYFARSGVLLRRPLVCNDADRRP